MKENLNDNQNYKSFLGSFVSSFISRIIVTPLDRVLILITTNQYTHYIQSHQSVFMFYSQLFKNIYKKEGFVGFFRGNVLNLMRIFPQEASELYLFSLLKQIDKYQDSKIFRVCSGGIASICAFGLFYPLEYSWCMISINQTPQNINLLKQISYVYKKDGYFGMYKGFSSSVFGTILYGSTKFQFYQIFKEYYQKGDQKQSIFGNFICGSLAGIIASLTSHPFEVVRKRRQVQILKYQTKDYTYLDLIKHIKHHQGIQGFYSGIVLSIIKVAPQVGLVLTLNDIFISNNKKKY